MEAEHKIQRRAAHGEDDPQQGAGPAASCVAHPADDHADEVGEKGKIGEDAHGPDREPRRVVTCRQGKDQQTGQIVGEERQYQIEDAVEQRTGIRSHGAFPFFQQSAVGGFCYKNRFIVPYLTFRRNADFPGGEKMRKKEGKAGGASANIPVCCDILHWKNTIFCAADNNFGQDTQKYLSLFGNSPLNILNFHLEKTQDIAYDKAEKCIHAPIYGTRGIGENEGGAPMRIIKRNGAEVGFDITKIIIAITKANESVEEVDRMTPVQIQRIAESVELQCQKMNRAPTVEEIQDMVEHYIMAHGAFEVAKHYITYRYTRSLVRKSNTTDDKILSLIECNNEEAKQENSNKNPVVNSTQRDYMAGEVSRDLSERILLPQDIVEAHREGIIHFHDSDYYAQHMHNCDLVNLEDMLQNGTVITGTLIEKPHSFATACNIATQIVAQVASNQYGGQSISLTHLAPFVQVSRNKIRASVREEFDAVGVAVTEDQINAIAEKRLREEIRRGVQTIQYQVVTLLTTNGQAPFITVFMYLGEARSQQEKADLAVIIEEMLLQRYQGVKNEKGVWVTPAFPKLIYVLEEDNIHEDSKYWYLTELAAKCTAKRMVPDYISEKKMLELKVDKNGEGHCYPCMGCRSFLTPYVDENGKPKYYGRFNQGVVTVNLPDIALSSGGNIEKFWRIFDERMELCHRALLCRHERLKGTLSDAAPILWQYGACARLKKGEPIDKLLYGGYSTISLGYAGLYECVKYMTGKSHTDPSATPFALEVMNALNAACKKWKAQHNIDFSLYGTPLESTTYKFAKCLQKRFGVVEGITDKGYVTNSYHVHVTEPIDAFKKLEFEAQFQHLSPGGAISYVEVPDMQNNLDAVLEVMKFIYDHIIYAELNTKSDYCQVCGWDGEIEIVEQDGKLIWKCPQCGNTDQDKMNVARRTCGYIGTQFWNQGRTQEIKDRVLHL